MTGRPRTTSREHLASVALALFLERGFEETTLEDIAAKAGVSRRTVPRYYASKADMVWGAFDERVQELRLRLAEDESDRGIVEVIGDAVVAFNDYGSEVLPELRERMTLITTVPALQGHAMLRYAEWCAAIAEFVARRLDLEVSDQIPQVIANVSLGVAMATYRHWIDHPDTDLLDGLACGFRLLSQGFATGLLEPSADGI